MKLTVNFDPGETMSNIGFVKAMIESGSFTNEDLKEICSFLYVASYVFGDKNRGDNK